MTVVALLLTVSVTLVEQCSSTACVTGTLAEALFYACDCVSTV